MGRRHRLSSWIVAVITHNTIHAPIFYRRGLNKLFQVWLSLSYGFPVSEYLPGHNLSHHKFTQKGADLMRTTRVRFGWNILNAIAFVPAVAFSVTLANFEFAAKMGKSRPAWLRQLRIETAAVWTVKAALLLIDWRKALLLRHHSARLRRVGHHRRELRAARRLRRGPPVQPLSQLRGKVVQLAHLQQRLPRDAPRPAGAPLERSWRRRTQSGFTRSFTRRSSSARSSSTWFARSSCRADARSTRASRDRRGRPSGRELPQLRGRHGSDRYPRSMTEALAAPATSPPTSPLVGAKSGGGLRADLHFMRISLSLVDYAVIGIYFAFVIGVGWALKRSMKGSADFLMSGRSIPAWITGLAFISANLGAQEVIGMAASGAKYGIMTSHFYWIGAIPAMVFLGIFMMPFYYGSKARSVPEYLKLRFDEKTRGFNAISFAVMTVFSSGISMYALASLLRLLLGWDFDACIAVSAGHRAGLHPARRPDLGDLQRGAAVLPDRVGLCAAGLPRSEGCRRLERPAGEAHSGGDRARAMRRAPGHNPGPTWAPPTPIRWAWSGLAWRWDWALSCPSATGARTSWSCSGRMAADSLSAARRTPLIAAVPKMLFPALLIVPGMIAVALPAVSGHALPAARSRRHS